MNSIDDIESIPLHMRCEACKGAGITLDPRTVIGIGILLEAGKAYLDRVELVCAHCRGSGIKEPG